MSDEAFAVGADVAAAFQRFFNATPDERARWLAEAADVRARERGEAAVVALTLNALLDKLGFSVEYAAHLVQPYCECRDTADGWDYCEHARDLGLTEV